MILLTDLERGICGLALMKMQQFWRYIDPDPWVDASDEEINALIRKLGLPSDEEVMLECPVCGRDSFVPLVDFRLNLALGGSPFSCGNESCPVGTVLVPVDLSMWEDECDSDFDRVLSQYVENEIFKVKKKEIL